MFDKPAVKIYVWDTFAVKVSKSEYVWCKKFAFLCIMHRWIEIFYDIVSRVEVVM